MTNHRKRTFSPEHNKGHDIENIITAPLVAAARANSKMQTEQTKFLMDFCFSKNGNFYDPVLIEMSLTKYEQDPDDKKKLKPYTLNFKIPLLTIIPINSLSVESVNVDFEMEVTSQTVVDSQTDTSVSNNFGGPGEKTQLRGRITGGNSSKSDANDKSQNSTKQSSSLSVKVKAGTLPLPVGVNTILDLYTKAIHPMDAQTKDS